MVLLTTAKKLSVAISAALPQWMTTIMMKTTLKNPSASICPLLTTFRQKACLILNSATAMKRRERWHHNDIYRPFPSVQDKPASTDNTSINGEAMTEIEEHASACLRSGTAHSLACSTRQRKPVTHVSRDELQALHCTG